MAWKRGTSVNQAREFRVGQVKEFLAPSSRETATEDEKAILRVTKMNTLSRPCVAYISAKFLKQVHSYMRMVIHHVY